MSQRDCVSVANFSAEIPAELVAERLRMHGVPCTIAWSGLIRDSGRSVWVSADRVAEAKAILTSDEVPEDEQTKEALSFPQPDDT